MNPSSDNDLALRWKTGDEEAYNELVSRHLAPIHRYVLSRCGNGHDAADICQEVFLEVCVKISNFNPEFPFTAWLFTIARRKVVDKFRKTRPLEEFDAQRHSETEFRQPSSVLEERESAVELWEKVFRLLPETQATALWLRVQDQKSVQEIAASMNQSESNVKVLLFRARQRLSQLWHSSSSAIQASIS